jgi:hypothetical protein
MKELVKWSEVESLAHGWKFGSYGHDVTYGDASFIRAKSLLMDFLRFISSGL